MNLQEYLASDLARPEPLIRARTTMSDAQRAADFEHRAQRAAQRSQAARWAVEAEIVALLDPALQLAVSESAAALQSAHAARGAARQRFDQHQLTLPDSDVAGYAATAGRLEDELRTHERLVGHAEHQHAQAAHALAEARRVALNQLQRAARRAHADVQTAEWAKCDELRLALAAQEQHAADVIGQALAKVTVLEAYTV